eukprot:gnl/TRDRNA2_/TRDRNA2_95514_c0_seq2.p1 gnl/TRDRNA2_/TRDRNA2_95514_c0~~gnl/TRDRNA2_/TRDRNA2_95514_c0_seq2.p1  ORF type:complete len:114 (-),score=13.77 gnl/TRDRNA2_/TRDRNA2_95514_c0_seq2:26-367(-)
MHEHTSAVIHRQKNLTKPCQTQMDQPGTAYNTIFVYSKLPTEHAVSRVFAVARCKVPAGSELFVCYAYEMHRGYEFEPPDVEDDNAIRKRIALRHPELSTNYGCSMMQDEYQE